MRVAETVGELALSRGEPLQRARLLSRACAHVLESHCIRVHLDGELPRRPAVLVCNHVSYLDPLAVLAHLPALPVAKAEVDGWPLLGRITNAFGVRFVRRDAPHSGATAIRWMIDTLQAGASVLAFPEGTTTHGDDVLRFKAGAFAAARHAGVAVVPLAIRYASRSLAWVGDDSFVPHYLETASRAETDVRLAVGEPLRPTRYSSDLELAVRARAAIAARLKETSWDSNELSNTSRAA
jgi:1-acyl-sn-glycerol-3-phosphate acyltransferase